MNSRITLHHTQITIVLRYLNILHILLDTKMWNITQRIGASNETGPILQ